MATTAELESNLEKQQADYLRRLENEGNLPKVVSDAWNAAGGEETKKLRGEEAKLLTDYVSSGARAREKYKDVWDPFARDRLAATQMSQEYAPISQVRSELAMRAEALGVATSSVGAMYQAGTRRAETGLGFTEGAYGRALTREQEAQRQKERAEQIAREDRIRQEDIEREDRIRAEEMAFKREQEARLARSSGGGGKASKPKEITSTMVNAGIKALQSVPSENPSDRAYDDQGQVIGSRDKVLSQNEALTALDQLIGVYGDEDVAYQILKRAFQAGGFTKYGDYDL